MTQLTPTRDLSSIKNILADLFTSTNLTTWKKRKWSHTFHQQAWNNLNSQQTLTSISPLITTNPSSESVQSPTQTVFSFQTSQSTGWINLTITISFTRPHTKVGRIIKSYTHTLMKVYKHTQTNMKTSIRPVMNMIVLMNLTIKILLLILQKAASRLIVNVDLKGCLKFTVTKMDKSKWMDLKVLKLLTLHKYVTPTLNQTKKASYNWLNQFNVLTQTHMILIKHTEF